MARHNFFSELQRRDVYRVAVAYVVFAWLILQAASILFPAFDAPTWGMRVLTVVLIACFPVVLIFAWIFELTPGGFKKTEDLETETSESVNTEDTVLVAKSRRRLNRLIIGALSLTVLLLLANQFWTASANTLLFSEKAESIAVLPFVNLSSDKDQEYFADGLAEELLNLLARIPELKVTSRSSAFSFKGQNVAVPVIAEKLGVKHILEGSVRKAGNQVRVTAQLIQVKEDKHLWSQTWDRELKDVFAIQDEIAESVVAALKLKLLEGGAPKASETDPAAYAFYLQAKHFRQQATANALKQAEQLANQALEIDSSYAPAWVELGTVYLNEARRGIKPFAEGMELSRNAVQKALVSDRKYAPAYAQLSRITLYDWDFNAAADYIKQARSLDAGNPEIIRTAGIIALSAGRFDEAIQLYEQSISMDPVSAGTYFNLGVAYLHNQQPAKSEASLRKGLALRSDFPAGQFFLSRSLLQQGKIKVALEEAKKEQDEVWNLEGRAIVLFKMGQNEASAALLTELIAKYAGDAAFQIAEVYAYRNEMDKAFYWLDRAYANRDPGLTEMLGNPLFDELHEDPRWEAFLKKMGFEV